MLALIVFTAFLTPCMVLGATQQLPLQFPYHHDLRQPNPTSLSRLAATLTLKARPTTVYRPKSFHAVEQARQRSLETGQSEQVEWNAIGMLGPDIKDKHTLAQLGRMAGNAYAFPGQKNWYDLDDAWNASFPFGWEDDEDGFRGHVFLSSDNSTVVLSIKGTTLQGPTSRKDKFNDNLLFSCCCARVDFTWIFHTVCDCYMHRWRCGNTCLTKALVQDSLFYSSGVGLVKDLLMLYPTADVWLVGHSLGGALASLLGSTFGLPAVAFESPGERLAAERLHLPLPSSLHNSSTLLPVTHVYHTADPIPQGTCTGFGSPCAQAGYALETRCHLGKSIVFDTVKLGWSVDVRTHPIKAVITRVLETEDLDVPEATEEEDCIDCFKWEFIDGEFN
ncbi:lipase [Moniliophthora roreri MCA 2997]|uniref:triacylglycerol lipase n=2 Tax=Moniliophthora roreri TaxID=221103 RepID=V2YDT9_MONRO|nr:lipase [Moniliophthora roreri MCA 2997]KAI3600016.1 lipase [Moniliophthora roreri]